MAQPIHETARKIAEGTGRAGRLMADVGERTAHAHAELLQHHTQALQQTMQAGTELWSKFANRWADQFARAFGMTGEGAEDLVQQSSHTLGNVVQSSAMLTQGMQSISNEWLEFTRQHVEQCMDRVDALMRCRTPQEMMAVQSDVMRDSLSGIIQTTRRTADLSAQMADEASRKMATNAAESGRRAA